MKAIARNREIADAFCKRPYHQVGLKRNPALTLVGRGFLDIH